LTGALRDVSRLEAKDLRRAMPRFAPDAYAANLLLLDDFAELAAAAGLSQAQLALAWVLSRGEHVTPIPGTTSPAHLEENLKADVALTPQLSAELDRLMDRHRVTGPRYNATAQAEVDTEQFAKNLGG
jgi:hypothetical protein